MNESKKIEPTDTMVEAGASSAWEEVNPGILGWNSISERHKEGCRRDARAVLTAALNHPDTAGLFADEDDREAEKRRTDIAESDAETLYERCERIREERDVLFRQCEYALDRAEKAEADLAEYMRTAAARDPAAIAREVLETAHEDDTITVCSVPDNKAAALARAVIAVAELADRLDAAAADDFDGVSGTSVSLVKYETAKAIRTALNGETHA